MMPHVWCPEESIGIEVMTQAEQDKVETSSIDQRGSLAEKNAYSQMLTGRLLLATACFSSVLLMSPMITAGPLALDEHVSYWTIDAESPGSVYSRSLDYAAVPPMFAWIQQLLTAICGKNEFLFRVPSALCFFAAIGVVYRLVSELRGLVTGGIAALILAWHPEVVDEVRIARPYGLVLLLASLVLLATVDCSKSSRQRLPHRWVFWICSAAALMWTHYTSALLVVITSIWLCGSCLKSSFRTTRLTYWFLANIVLAVICLPLIPAVTRLREWGPFLNYMAADQPLRNFIGPFWWLGVPVGCGCCFIARRVFVRPMAVEKKEPRFESLPLLVACSLLPLLVLAYLASDGLSSLANPRYRVAYAPAGACLLAILLQRRSTWWLSASGAVIAIMVSWGMSPLLPWQSGRLGSPADTEWFEVSRMIAEKSNPGEPLFVQSGLTESSLVAAYPEDSAFLEYVACRVSRFYVDSAHPRIGLPFLWEGPSGVRSAFREKLSVIISADGSFWVAAAVDTDLNRGSLAGFQQLIAETGFRRIEYQDWPGVILERYVSKSQSADR
jgi:hypothetical protein